nr:MAG TPA: tail protein [Caudoviricetes sp.]
MIKSFTITNHMNDMLKIDLEHPESSGFIVNSVSGLGAVKADINTTKLISTDGVVFNSARVNERNIVFDLMFMKTDFETIEDIRQKTYRFFPVKSKIDIVVETDNRNLKTKGYVESNTPNIFSKEENTQISIICPEPYFHSAGDKNVTTFYGVESKFEFPFSNESTTNPLIVFGEIRNNAENYIEYTGDSEVGVVVKIFALGQVKNPKIYNVKTNEFVKIDTSKISYGIKAGDNIIINSIKGRKGITLIRDGEEINIIYSLDKQTTWLQLRNGTNVFAFTSDEGTSNIQLQIENDIIYEGV